MSALLHMRRRRTGLPPGRGGGAFLGSSTSSWQRACVSAASMAGRELTAARAMGRGGAFLDPASSSPPPSLAESCILAASALAACSAAALRARQFACAVQCCMDDAPPWSTRAEAALASAQPVPRPRPLPPRGQCACECMRGGQRTAALAAGLGGAFLAGASSSASCSARLVSVCILRGGGWAKTTHRPLRRPRWRRSLFRRRGLVVVALRCSQARVSTPRRQPQQ